MRASPQSGEDVLPRHQHLLPAPQPCPHSSLPVRFLHARHYSGRPIFTLPTLNSSPPSLFLAHTPLLRAPHHSVSAPHPNSSLPARFSHARPSSGGPSQSPRPSPTPPSQPVSHVPLRWTFHPQSPGPPELGPPSPFPTRANALEAAFSLRASTPTPPRTVQTPIPPIR
jgi:hypothetical protein